MLPVKALDSVAVKTLSHASFRVLVLIAAQFNGHNNGALGLTASQAADAGIGSNKTLYRSLQELETRRLIQKTFPASRVPPRPTMWSLAWIPLDDTKYTSETKQPTHAYLNWQPGSKAA
ncbi:MAG: hypothetical protein SH820_17295 [Xanthomonadales bacterium]|nr:hypothetical protein [Xanthomonadales bacterium]